MSRFAGEKFTTCKDIAGIRTLDKRDMESYGNSGAAAISLAEYFGASRITLIGYDLRKTTKAHWHGDHPKGLGNAGPVKTWPERFRKLGDRINKTVDVANCTPGSLLDCFKFSTLAERLT